MWRLCTAIKDRGYEGHEPVPELEPLAPKYDPLHHRAYVSVLENAVMRQPTVRNIALSGTYGTGKSSILAEFARRFKDRVLEVSLLTLGEEPEKILAPAEEANPAAATTTNRIQKEIVKQLLYQQSPSAAPESRFRRITRFLWHRELAYALLSGLVALAVLAASGLNVSALPNIGLALEPLPSWLRTLSIWASIPFVLGSVVLVVRLFIHGRIKVENVSAGPATITLPARSTSYFDEYLDEIIYFFETNGKRDILVIEDLDRFNDPRIFESLRSLNSLLNAAKQLKGRNIRFIYAVRDSVFEKLGRDVDETSDEAKNELKRANRTKFFELVIPVVPFITHKNARDLMLNLLERRGHEISKDLIDLAARHVADMRLIHNIVNEYEIFEHRLLKVENAVPELDPDRLFAMVLLKNAHSGDFEAIRHGTSTLDELFKAWRGLVSANIQSIRKTNNTLRHRIETAEASAGRAAELAAKLLKVIDSLAVADGSPLVQNALYVDSNPTDQESMATPSFWSKVFHSEVTLSVLTRGQYDRYSGRETNVHMILTAKAVQDLIREDLNIELYENTQVVAAKKRINQSQDEISFLRRHTWKQLIEKPNFHYRTSADESERNFREIAEALLPSSLVVGLVVGGYITSHFTLYVSSFYGQLIRPDAMIYIMRNVDHGIADSQYRLTSADVEAIVRDQGLSVLHERSMYNISILDYLLSIEIEQAAIVIRNLAASNNEDLDFIDLYLESGAEKSVFVTQLTPFMPSIFDLILRNLSLEKSEKAEIVDAAIGARKDMVEYRYSKELREFVEENYGIICSFISNEGAAGPGEVVDFLDQAGAELTDLVLVSEKLCFELSETNLYNITANNLQCVLRDENLSLDRLRSSGKAVYVHAVKRIGDYKNAFFDSVATEYTIEDPKVFEIILNESISWQPSDFDFVVSNAHPNCRIDDLIEVPVGAWSPLIAGGRTLMTYSNIERYIESRGSIDDVLAGALLGCVAIQYTEDTEDTEDTEQSGRAALALAILNAPDHLPDLKHRIKLANSLQPGQLPTDSVEPESGEKIGRLIEDGLILDDEDAFSSRLMIDWGTMEYAIRASTDYENLVSAETLPTEYLPKIMASQAIGSVIRRKALNLINKGIFVSVSAAAYESIADAEDRGDLDLNAVGVNLLIKGKVKTSRVIRIISKKCAGWDLKELQGVLENLGEPYSRISEKSRRITKLSDTPEHHAILNRLKDGGVVSNFPVGADGKLKVTLRRSEV